MKDDVTRHIPPNMKLYTAGAFVDKTKAVSICQAGRTTISDLQSLQEEADVRIMLHVAYSAQNGSKRVVVRASGIVTLCIDYADKIRGLKELWIWKSMNEFIPAHEIAASLGPTIVNVLPALHAITGCDTTSRLYRKGKKSAMRII